MLNPGPSGLILKGLMGGLDGGAPGRWGRTAARKQLPGYTAPVLQGQASMLATAVGDAGTTYRLWKLPSRRKYFH